MSLNNTSKVSGAINAVLNRDETWLSYYEREVKLGELDKDQVERAEVAEPILVTAALTESKYASLIWNGGYTEARQVMENSIDKVASADTPLGGWHSVWLGAAFDLEGDPDSADRSYGIARSRIGPAIALPRPNKQKAKVTEEQLNSFALSLKSYLGYSSGGKCDAEITKLKIELNLMNSGTSNQAESAIRKLGEILGFSSTRPDNDQGTGPDVLWIENENNIALGFELKTDKDSPATYFKKEVSQGHDHLSWIKQQYPKHTCSGLLYVGPDGVVDTKANPSSEMGLCTIETMTALRDQVLALIDDLMKSTPIERITAIEKESILEKWRLISLFKHLRVKGMDGLQ